MGFVFWMGVFRVASGSHNDGIAWMRLSMRLSMLILVPLIGCAGPVNQGNPLIGAWRAEVPTPIGYFNVGRLEFSSDRMHAFGGDVDVDYEISGSAVRVILRDFGPELELKMVDANNARLTTPPLLGPLIDTFVRVNLRRVE
jgi:hypothetical protein